MEAFNRVEILPALLSQPVNLVVPIENLLSMLLLELLRGCVNCFDLLLKSIDLRLGVGQLEIFS